MPQTAREQKEAIYPRGMIASYLQARFLLPPGILLVGNETISQNQDPGQEGFVRLLAGVGGLAGLIVLHASVRHLRFALKESASKAGETDSGQITRLKTC